MATYYVDITAADDAGTGTIGDPWKYVRTHCNGVAAGDTIYVRGDTPGTRTHEETAEVEITKDGSAGNLITLMPFTGENVKLQATAGEDRILNLAADYWWIEGFEFDGQSYDMDIMRIQDGDHNTIYDCEMYDFRNAIDLRRADYNLFDNLIMYDAFKGNDQDATGICIMSGTNNEITNCTIYDIRGDCITAVDAYEGVGNLLIEDCVLYTTLLNCSENAIDIKQGDGIIRNCVIHGFWVCDATCGGSGGAGQGIVIHNDTGTYTIEYCEIYDCTCGATLEEGCVVTFQKNLVYDLHGADGHAYQRAAVRVLYGSEVWIYNCTFDDAPEHLYIFDGTGSTVVTVKNNIHNDTGDIDLDNAPTVTYDYNCWHNASDTLVGANDVNDDPDFVDEVGNDFHLQAVSPCVDAGTNVGLPFWGTMPDIGRYEYWNEVDTIVMVVTIVVVLA